LRVFLSEHERSLHAGARVRLRAAWIAERELLKMRGFAGKASLRPGPVARCQPCANDLHAIFSL
jgi:hypothetical protein